jgi:16S rRNA (adenine1518-N6/adenine1519-N6)-dimethyltransferase
MSDTLSFSQSIKSSAFVPRKSLGQNFLVDQRMIARMVRACEFSRSDTVLEIGPGQGALTFIILPQVQQIIAVETDARLAEQLILTQPPDKLKVIHKDFLKYDFSDLTPPLKLVGNLPYYISTPIMLRFLEQRKIFTDFHFTVQLEFGKRLVASPGTKDYSSLTCFVNYFTEPTLLFHIPNSAFRPAPKIKSCFMRLKVRPQPLVRVNDEPFFLNLVRLSFLQRRKMLINTLSSLNTRTQLTTAFEKASIPLNARAEELTVEQFGSLANQLTKLHSAGNKSESDTCLLMDG